MSKATNYKYAESDAGREGDQSCKVGIGQSIVNPVEDADRETTGKKRNAAEDEPRRHHRRCRLRTQLGKGIFPLF